MYKKFFFSLIALISSLTIWAGEPVPEFVMRQAGETFQRYIEWKNGEETLVFPVITDVHTNDRETYRHVGYLAHTDRLFSYDFMVNLGDIGLNIGSPHDDAGLSRQIVEWTRSEMAEFPGVFLYVAGNHDWDGGEGTHLTSKYLSDVFQSPAHRYADGNMHLVEGTVYGYYDVPEKRVRMILLNSSATETLSGDYYCYGKKQLDWLTGLLNDTPIGMDVIILSHFMPHRMGHWKPKHNIPRPATSILTHLLADYVNRRAGGEQEVTWDFTHASGSLVGVVAGDSHVNNFICDDGVNYFVTQGYGNVGKENMQEGQRRAEFNYRESLCCDVVAVKLKSKEVRVFRIGAGGKEFDQEFTYGNEPLPAGFTITAHSGAYNTPPNSMQFIDTSLENDADILEFDVRLRPDGELAMSHDAIKDNDAELIEPVMMKIKGRRTHINLDIKEPRTLRSLYKLIKRLKMADQVFLTGVEDQAIPEVKKSCPGIAYYLNFAADVNLLADPAYQNLLLAKLRETGAVGINCNYKYCTSLLAELPHKNGYLLSVWTVDKVADMHRVLRCHPDNITTRKPLELKEVLAGR